MKKNIGRDVNRVPLHTVVPRTVPFAIGIAASDICNFRCNYCNQSTDEGIREARILPFDDFLLIKEQIKQLTAEREERLKIIRFIGNGEPLINKLLPEMIKSLVDIDAADRYEVTTNGSLLTEQMSDELIDAGLTRLLVSIQGVTPEKYKDICGYNIQWEKFISQISYFYEKSRGKCQIYIKTVNTAVRTEEEKEQFYSLFSDISDDIAIENIIPSSEGIDFSDMLTEEELKSSRYGEEYKPRLCCDTLFMYMNIHSNGDVDCCGCIYPPLFIGNVFKTPLNEIWNGKVHKEIMKKHLQGKRCDIEKCSRCESILKQNDFEEDMLDDYMDEILERVIKL